MHLSRPGEFRQGDCAMPWSYHPNRVSGECFLDHPLVLVSLAQRDMLQISGLRVGAMLPTREA